MKLEPTNDGKYTIIADNNQTFIISKNVKNKIGSFIKFMQVYHFSLKYGMTVFEKYLHSHDPKISAYKYYEEIAQFIANNDRLINFNNLHLVDTDLGIMNRDNQNWNEVPIYYKECYTSANPYDNYSCKTNAEKEANRKVFALKFKENKHFTDEHDINKNNENRNECAHYYGTIKNELANILNSGHTIAVTDIPSSTQGVTTVLDHAIHDLSIQYPNIINASHLLVRTKSKKSAHNGKGTKSRSIIQNMDTLDVSQNIINKLKLLNIEAIVVLDDVTTTGASFIAIDNLLNQHKDLNMFPIINLAYAHVAHGYYISPKLINTTSNDDNNQIRGVIFDVDKTLMNFNSEPIDKQAHDHLNDFKHDANLSIPNEDSTDTLLFSFINYLIFHNIKVAIISNLNQDKLNYVLNLEEPNYKLYAVSAISNKAKITNNNPNSYYKYRYVYRAKPSPYWILQAINHMGLSQNDRIVGVGNQESDILAYKQAGIDPVFVSWFNGLYKGFGDPYYNSIPLVDYKATNVKNFNHIIQFIHWFERRNSELNKNPFNPNITDFQPSNFHLAKNPFVDPNNDKDNNDTNPFANPFA